LVLLGYGFCGCLDDSYGGKVCKVWNTRHPLQYDLLNDIPIQQ
jgi:hypothetical protein